MVADADTTILSTISEYCGIFSFSHDYHLLVFKL
jgi:hypothetical protein